MYPAEIVAPMTRDLTTAGFEPLQTPDAVVNALESTEGTALLVVNSVCGCAAAMARPGVKMALQNNTQIKNQLLKTEYIKALIGTAGNIPKTSAMVEYGQINSAYNDTKFTIGQSMAFPTVYKRQHQLRTEEWKSNV